MQFRNATTVLKKSCIPWLTVKEDSGMNGFSMNAAFVSHVLGVCSCSFVFLFCFMLPVSDRVERIFREINNSILEGSLVITLRLEKLPHVLSRFIALFGLLVCVFRLYLLFLFRINIVGF